MPNLAFFKSLKLRQKRFKAQYLQEIKAVAGSSYTQIRDPLNQKFSL